MAPPFLSRLKDEVLVADGAMGTLLQAQGLPQDVADSVQGEELAIALDQVHLDSLYDLKDEPEEEGDAHEGDGSRQQNGHPWRSERFHDDQHDRFQGQQKGRRDDDSSPSQTSREGLHLASLSQA